MSNRFEREPKKNGEKLTQPNYQFDRTWFDVSAVSETVRAIYEPNHFEEVFSFEKLTKSGSVLFDTGMGLADISTALSGKPHHVFLTHSHWDHTGGAYLFNQVSILNHPFEVDRLTKGWKKSETVGYDPSEFLVDVPSPEQLESFFIPGIQKFNVLGDQDTLTVDGLEIIVLHTPGHTPGSTCYFLPEYGELIAGDTLYPGPAYLHLSESNVNDFLASLYKLKSLIGPDIKSILPGHNKPIYHPSLLDAHIAGLEGSLKPNKITEGVDEFGPYTRKQYDDFALMLPR